MPEDTATVEPGSPPVAPSKGGKVRLLSFEDLDKRTKPYQQAVELRDELIGERGGESALDAMRIRFIEDVAITSAMIRDAQVRWLKGEQIGISEIATLLNSRRRDAEQIGGPEPRDVTPDITTFMASRAAQKASSAA
ncbi:MULTISPECIES: hypothetical protein [unclassified Mesorhizobium]|uniref:hypothetical protein n=1 Tax=unclassified Mesorhizobium TaxID=325217 RepID=UPI000F7579BD|nr:MULTISPECIES: hypothetical protein [unclassified Mesorhizobium]TGT59535.1 hypothetical protein EN813_028470 [Mesorhizobium sp. M00.F.Ca.ET.170.01.1.1]AZO12528.1 hypothetical protein EJ074_27945 [Mesorhizobium sp. M3A.F.Ca.ET.080.04.2.1]RWB68427.1 MAG: hypothetical protein EOQ49_23040 [Mesorhizobium sp.]RWB91013.1 MAG: hypothetical protein EOQ52_06125 [Mesorhizobium sp.]RWE23521.1 MAG: hypothetical protein EOS41_20345 [Mesorhizobium sp.]